MVVVGGGRQMLMGARVSPKIGSTGLFAGSAHAGGGCLGLFGLRRWNWEELLREKSLFSARSSDPWGWGVKCSRGAGGVGQTNRARKVPRRSRSAERSLPVPTFGQPPPTSQPQFKELKNNYIHLLRKKRHPGEAGSPVQGRPGGSGMSRF